MNHLTATGNHALCGITQCYLPLGSSDFPTFTPAEVEVTWVVVILHDSSPPKTVIYLRNNQAASWPGHDYPTFTPAEAGAQFSDPERCKAEMTWVVVMLYRMIYGRSTCTQHVW